jgi:hypothetical protein
MKSVRHDRKRPVAIAPTLLLLLDSGLGDTLWLGFLRHDEGSLGVGSVDGSIDCQ